MGRFILLAAVVLSQGCATSKLLKAADSPSLLSPVQVEFQRVTLGRVGQGLVIHGRLRSAVVQSTTGEGTAPPFAVGIAAVSDAQRWFGCPRTAGAASPQPLVLDVDAAVPADAAGPALELHRYEGSWLDLVNCAAPPDAPVASPQSIGAYLDPSGNLILVHAPAGEGGTWHVAGIPAAALQRGTRWRLFRYGELPAALPFTVVFDVITFPLQAAGFALGIVCWGGNC